MEPPAPVSLSCPGVEATHCPPTALEGGGWTPWRPTKVQKEP